MTTRLPVPPPSTPVTCVDDLDRVWRGLMGPYGFDAPVLYAVFLDPDSRLTPLVIPIDDLPRRPDRRLLDSLAGIVAQLVDEGAVGSVALLYGRPSADLTMTEDDRSWGRALAGICRPWPAWFATDAGLRAFTPDDLVGAPAGERTG